MDTLTTQQRSERMARIRSKHTKPEIAIRQLAFGLGYRFRLHARSLPGSPDLAIKNRKKAIFVHGCFWHGHEGCKLANRPKTRTDYWDAKFARNQARDARNEAALTSMGWETLIIWECELKDKDAIAEKMQTFLGPSKRA